MTKEQELAQANSHSHSLLIGMSTPTVPWMGSIASVPQLLAALLELAYYDEWFKSGYSAT